MLEGLKFWGSCVKWALHPHSLKQADDLYGGLGILFLTALFGVICWLLGVKNVTFGGQYAQYQQGALLFFLALICTFVLRLVAAPFVAWRRERDARLASEAREAELRLRSEPHIALKGPFLHRDEDNYAVRLEAQNTGAKLLERCNVSLVEMTPHPPGWKYSTLPRDIPTDRQQERAKYGRFNLDPGRPKFLTMLYYASGNPRTPIRLVTESETFSLPPDQTYRFKLVASSESGRTSILEFTARVESDLRLEVAQCP